MGTQTADVLQSALAGASSKSSGILATIIGVVTLLVTASGVFGEMQTALNKIWDVEPRTSTVSRLIWARAVSLGLVAALGFLLLVSLAVSAVLTAFGTYLNSVLPFGSLILSVVNFVVSLALISVLFAAIYKVLPDRPIAWRDVITGAIVTALLFTAGKSLIGWYLGSSAVASSYGAAGGLIILLLWVYYSTQIFLLGAEFTKAYASIRRGEDLTTGPSSNRRPEEGGAGTKEDRRSSLAGVGNPLAPTTERSQMTDHEPSLRELERDAERNRVDLMNTVDALQKRISPAAIKHDVQGYVRGKKDSLLHSLEQRARDNPVQTVAIAAGAAYPLWGIISRIPVPLLLIGAGLALTRRSAEDQDQGDNASFLDRARERLGQSTDEAHQKADEVAGVVKNRVNAGMDSARRAGDQLSEYANQASDAASNVAASVGQKAAQSAETVWAVSSDAASKAGDMLSPERMRRSGTQVSDWVNNAVSRNPLIVGAVGLVIGAVIAAALPSTPQEDKLLGPAADDLKQKAGDAALEGVAAAKEIATDIYQEAATRAKEQGLSVDDAKEFAGQIGEKIKTAVANATGEDLQPGDQENSPQTTSGATG